MVVHCDAPSRTKDFVLLEELVPDPSDGQRLPSARTVPSHHNRVGRRFLVLIVVMWLSPAVVRGESQTEAPIRVTPGLFATAEDDLGLKTVTGRHQLLYRATVDSYKFCHHPNLVVFGGKLYCMWSNGIVGEDQPGQRILLCHSTDGAMWTEPTVLTEHKQSKGVCVAAGFYVSGDALAAFYTTTMGKNFGSETELLARTSSDGESWSDPHRIAGGFFIEAPGRLPGGRLLLAGEHVDPRRASGRMKLLFTDESDALSGWREARVEPGDLKVFGYTEPNVLEQTGGRIVMLFRNYSGFLFASASLDRGETWSQPAQTNFPDSTARFSTGQLPSGTVYVINNPGPKQFDRSRLTIALSDDGRTFDRGFLLRGEPTQKRYEGQSKLDGWQYPHSVVWNDHLYVAYSINKEDVGLTRIALKTLSPPGE